MAVTHCQNKKRKKNQMAVTCMSFNKPELLEDMGEVMHLQKYILDDLNVLKAKKH